MNSDNSTAMSRTVEVLDGELTESTESMLSQEEAQELNQCLKESFRQAQDLFRQCAYYLLQMDERQGWKALGYRGFSDWLKKEIIPCYGLSERYLQRLKQVAAWERNVMQHSKDVNPDLIAELPVSQRVIIAQIPSIDKQVELLKECDQRKSQGNPHTASSLKDVVKRIKEQDQQAHLEKIPSAWQSDEYEVDFPVTVCGKSFNVIFQSAKSDGDYFHRFQLVGEGVSPTGAKTHYAYFDDAHQHESPQVYIEQVLGEILQSAEGAGGEGEAASTSADADGDDESAGGEGEAASTSADADGGDDESAGGEGEAASTSADTDGGDDESAEGEGEAASTSADADGGDDESAEGEGEAASTSADADGAEGADADIVGRRVVVVCPPGWVEMPSAPSGYRGTVQSHIPKKKSPNLYKVLLDKSPAPGKRRDVAIDLNRFRLIPFCLGDIQSSQDLQLYLSDTGTSVSIEIQELDSYQRRQLGKIPELPKILREACAEFFTEDAIAELINLLDVSEEINEPDSLMDCQSEEEFRQYLNCKDLGEIWREIRQSQSPQNDNVSELSEFKANYRKRMDQEASRKISAKDERIAELEKEIAELRRQIQAKEKPASRRQSVKAKAKKS